MDLYRRKLKIYILKYVLNGEGEIIIQSLANALNSEGTMIVIISTYPLVWGAFSKYLMFQYCYIKKFFFFWLKDLKTKLWSMTWLDSGGTKRQQKIFNLNILEVR